MRFTELSIQTQRAAPSELRTNGLAFLYRAGYISRVGEPLALGQLAIDKLRAAAIRSDPQNFLSQTGLVVVHSAGTGEYFGLYESGADELLVCPACGYAERRELALCRRQPFSREELLPLEKVLTPECSTIAQLALFMQIPQEKTAKALMFTRLQDNGFVFVVVRGDLQISEAKLKQKVGQVRLASADEIAASGAVAGYASPVGLQRALIVVDDLVAHSPNLVAGANEHGYHLKNTNYPRDYQARLIADVTLASSGDPCPDCGTSLQSQRAAILYSDGSFNFDQLLLTLAEVHHDEKGLLLPRMAAPFEVYLMNVPGKTLDTAAAGRDLYQVLTGAGFTVLFDDRDERAGVKFNDADLIGSPIRITVGERGLQSGMVEIKRRPEAEVRQIPLDAVVNEIKAG